MAVNKIDQDTIDRQAIERALNEAIAEFGPARVAQMLTARHKPVPGAYLNDLGSVSLCNVGMEEQGPGFASRLYAEHTLNENECKTPLNEVIAGLDRSRQTIAHDENLDPEQKHQLNKPILEGMIFLEAFVRLLSESQPEIEQMQDEQPTPHAPQAQPITRKSLLALWEKSKSPWEFYCDLEDRLFGVAKDRATSAAAAAPGEFISHLPLERQSSQQEAVATDWVICPICGESDMRKEVDAGGHSLIHCVNTNCASNGGTMDARPLAHDLADADRRAGAAERHLESCRNDLIRIERVRDEMKYQWGVSSNVSFDVVWAEALALKNQSLAPLTKEQRQEICTMAEAAMQSDPNLSWRDALISQTEAALGVKKEA